MKLGTCLLLLATENDPLAQSLIPTIGAAGYDYAEVSLARLLPLSEARIADYLAAFLENNLPVEVFNNAVPRGLALIGPSADPAAISDYMDRALHLAGLLGVSMITMSGPNKRTVPTDYLWDRGFPEYVRFLQQFADRAAARDITLVIEPINDEEHSFISTVAAAADAVRAAGRKNVKTMIDSYHFIKQGDDPGLMLQNISSIAHIHYAAQPRRTYPLADDIEDFQALLARLTAAGYRGRISLEAYTPDPAHDLPKTRQLITRCLSSLSL